MATGPEAKRLRELMKQEKERRGTECPSGMKPAGRAGKALVVAGMPPTRGRLRSRGADEASAGEPSAKVAKVTRTAAEEEPMEAVLPTSVASEAEGPQAAHGLPASGAAIGTTDESSSGAASWSAAVQAPLQAMASGSVSGDESAEDLGRTLPPEELPSTSTDNQPQMGDGKQAEVEKAMPRGFFDDPDEEAKVRGEEPPSQRKQRELESGLKKFEGEMIEEVEEAEEVRHILEEERYAEKAAEDEERLAAFAASVEEAARQHEEVIARRRENALKMETAAPKAAETADDEREDETDDDDADSEYCLGNDWRERDLSAFR